MKTFHRHTRASYVYNRCLAWCNVVLTQRIHSSVEIEVQVCRPTAGDSCDGRISVLYDCLLSIVALTLTYSTPQLYNIHITVTHMNGLF